MESTDKPAGLESGKPVSVAKPEIPPTPPAASHYLAIDVVFRILLFASSLVAVLVMVTSKQTELIAVTGIPFKVPLTAKFNNSPAFIYFVVALSIACLYSIITILASFSVILKPVFPAALLSHLAIIDVLMLGLVASATGTAGGVAYIGLKGNSHVGWAKVCPHYGKFCRHLGGSIAVSLFASVILVLLVILSIYSLSRRNR